MSNLGENMQKLILIFLLLFNGASFADSSAHVNQTTVYKGDPITLTVQTNTNSMRPNLESLQKDFNILSLSTSSQINITHNGRLLTKSWILTLQPKSMGELTIPALKVGNELTKPIQINIVALPPEIKAEADKHVRIEASVNTTNNETFVQQQIPYTIRITFDSSMISGEISSLNIKNAVVEQLGKDKQKNIVKAGKRLTVIEKHFVISPEKSGELIIPPITLTGRIALSGGDAPKLRRRLDETDMLNKFFGGFPSDSFFNDPFFKRRPSAPTKPFSISTKEIIINVLPVPAKSKGAWLPAEALSIEDSWHRNPPELKVGEPVLRTLVLKAKGIAGSQIPEITLAKPDGIKTYIDRGKSETETDGKTLYGFQTFSITYIPSKSGAVTFPEVKVDWWNIKAKKQETFVLPKWSLNVAKGTLAEEETVTSQQEEVTQTKPVVEEPEESNTETITDKPFDWKIFLLSSLAVLIVGFFTFWFIQRQKIIKTTKLQTIATDIKPLKESVLEACENNDNHRAAKALLALIQAQWNNQNILNLGLLIKETQHQTDRDVITHLEKSLYAPNSHQWDGKALSALIKKGIVQKNKTQRTKNDALKPLYPA